MNKLHQRDEKKTKYTESRISQASFPASDVETCEVDRWKNANIQLHPNVDVRTRLSTAFQLHAKHYNQITLAH